VHTRVDTSERDNANRQAAAADVLKKLQNENKTNAKAAEEQASTLFGNALRAESEAKKELDVIEKTATEKIQEAKMEYDRAKDKFDADVATINAAVQKAGVDQPHVVSFIREAMDVRNDAVNSRAAAKLMAGNMNTMGALLKQNFEVDEVKTVSSVQDVIKSRAPNLIPFTDYIVNELGFIDKTCCIFSQKEAEEALDEFKQHVTGKGVAWNRALGMMFTRLATGVLFQPTDEEKIALADRAGKEADIGEKLQHIGEYLLRRGAVVSAQLNVCSEINTRDVKRLR